VWPRWLLIADMFNVLWSLPFPFTSIFMQMTLNSSSLSAHSALTRAYLTFKTLFNRSLPGWLLIFLLLTPLRLNFLPKYTTLHLTHRFVNCLYHCCLYRSLQAWLVITVILSAIGKVMKVWSLEVGYTQPPYLHNLISVQRPRRTRSSSVVTLAWPPTSSCLKITDRSLRCAHAPCLWNQLFVDLILVPVPPFPIHLFFHPSLLPLLIHHMINHDSLSLSPPA